MTTLLIADDDDITRLGLRVELANATGIEVVGEASDAEQALELTQQLKPEVILLEVALPPLPIVILIGDLRSRYSPPPNLVMLGTQGRFTVLLETILAGASGYVLRCDWPHIARAVDSVSAGLICLSPTVRLRLFEDQPRLSLIAKDIPLSSLQDEPSEYEFQVLRFVASGLSNRQIATQLHVEERRIRYDVEKLMNMIGAANRTQLAVQAILRGWINPNEIA